MSSSADPISSISGTQLASEYGYVDPYGTTSALYNALYGTGGSVSSGALGLYNENADSIISQISGETGALADTLNATATAEANEALDTAASNFANYGALNSGAAANAFGEAIATPFAEAQAQLQSAQLEAGSNALTSLLNLSGSTYSSGLSSASSLMENSSGLVSPTYYTNPEYTAQQETKNTVLGGLTGGVSKGIGTATGNYLTTLLGG